MRKLEFIMGMPIIIEVVDFSQQEKAQNAISEVFNYFKWVDDKFSPYKQNSEVSLMNSPLFLDFKPSKEMTEILKLSEQTKRESDGYFDVFYNGGFNPSGIVKGWAIYNAAKILDKLGFVNYYVDAGGDIQTKGRNKNGKKWAIGIRNPFEKNKNVKIIYLSGEGIATSGTYERGNHIYNPKIHELPTKCKSSVLSITVIGPNVYEADRFSTPAFVMGKKGIDFIEKKKTLEGYMIDVSGVATMTTGFEKYVEEN